jgi:hypothetical protein
MYKCVPTLVDSSLSDLFTSSWSPSHIDLYCFKVSVLVSLQWRHQTLSCLGFPTYPCTYHMCSSLSMWLKSNHIAIFALDLKSTYEGEHMIFGLLSLANLDELAILPHLTTLTNLVETRSKYTHKSVTWCGHIRASTSTTIPGWTPK